MRLVFEINDAMKDRTQEFTDYLESVVPQFDEYRRIVNAIVHLEEDNLPKEASKAESNINPYPQNQVGFTRRAILGELVKFSMHLNHRDEMVRNQIVSMFFQLISDIDHSYSDYQHLLKSKFMIKQPEKALEGDLSDLGDGSDDEVYQQDETEQELTFTIRDFRDVNFGRSLQEYCKPYVLEPMTLDFDDVASVIVSVVRRLLYTRVDDFQLEMMKAISDISQPLIVQADIPMQEEFLTQLQQNVPEGISFEKQRAYFAKKLEAQHDKLQIEDGFDQNEFNRNLAKFKKLICLIEEVNLKEKFCVKRALILCRSLLKQCR